MKIHLIEKHDRLNRISDDEQLWESGYWTVPTQTAEELLGGDIYLHSMKAKPSKFGGVIQSYRVAEDAEFKGKIVFTFLADLEHKNVSTSNEGWGMEKKIDKN
jgi:hypothetical protein